MQKLERKDQPLITEPLIARFRPHFGPVLILLIATFATYGRILGHDFLVNWDDPAYVTANPAIQGLTWQNIKTIFTSYYVGNYAPLQMLSYLLDHQIWGFWAGGYLLSNLLIHWANGMLLYALLVKWHQDRIAATVAAALFLLHPLQVESVAWVSQRKNLLAMFFFLVAWACYDRYRQAGRGRRKGAYLLSVAAFALALLAKSVAVVFPVVLLLHDFCFPGSGKRNRLVDKLPFLILALLFSVLAMFSQTAEFDGHRMPYGLFDGNRGNPLFVMLPVFCRYVSMVLWPMNLSAIYEPPLHGSPDLVVAASALLVAAIFLLLFLAFRHDRRLGFHLSIFLIGLLPVLQIIPLPTLMNDRYLYFPMLGVAGACALGIRHARNRFCGSRSRYAVILPFVLLSSLAAISFNRCAVWHDALSLWQDTVAKYPNSSRAWGNLGQALDIGNDWNAAKQAYATGLQLGPSNFEILYNWGTMNLELGEFDLGYKLLSRLLEIAPRHVKGLTAMGDLLVIRHDFDAADKLYHKALALQPDSIEVNIALGNLAVLQGWPDRARVYFKSAESRGGADPEVAFHLACVESMAGKHQEALNWLEAALQRGFRDENKLRRMVELSELWGDPRYEALLLQYFPSPQQQAGSKESAKSH